MKKHERYFLVICALFICFAAFAISSLFALKFRAAPHHAYAQEYTVNDIRNLLKEESDSAYLELYNEDGTMQIIPEPMITQNGNQSRTQALATPTFNERKILDSGKSDSDSIIITIMGDGFTATQQNDFINAATDAIDKMLGNPQKNLAGCYPFNLYRDYFTVYAIEVISNESGVSRDAATNNGVIVDNYFGSSFYYGNNTSTIDRALVITNYNRADELKKPNSAMTAIICNSKRWGGTGGRYAVVSCANNYERIMLHEFGHSFGGLADEYYVISDGPFRGGEAPNRTSNNDANSIKWKDLLGYDNVGIYPYSTGVNINDPNFDSKSNLWFKPHLNCKMQYAEKDFCPVCANELINQLELNNNRVFITFDKQGGQGGDDDVYATYQESMPAATAPTRTGYTFNGYYSEPKGKGIQYYDADMVSVRNWDNVKSQTLYAYWVGNKYTITLDAQGGTGGTSSVTATYEMPMPTLGVKAPTKQGYTFKGYFSGTNGSGIKYYDGPDMESVHDWDKTEDTTLYAYWEQIKYTVTLHGRQITEKVSVAYGEMMPLPHNSDQAPSYEGHEFVGYFSGENGSGTQYYAMVLMRNDAAVDLGDTYSERMVPIRTWDHFSDGDLYVCWKVMECNYSYINIKQDEGYFDERTTVHLIHGEPATIKAKDFDGYDFLYFEIGSRKEESPMVWKAELERNGADGLIYPVFRFRAVYRKKSCVAEGTLITLADGEQVPVEMLTGDETLLVWNLFTGTFDTAPILCIDRDSLGTYEVINLYFSDDTQVKVISEHAFWDFDLNKYVYLDKDASEYIGHWFNKQTTDENGNFVTSKVQLTSVVIQSECTVAYSPVTYGHLCYYVDGMLSMPGGISGLFNIFDVDSETMSYNKEAMAADIEQYGLFTYEEFAESLPVSQELFEAVNGQYFKVAIGKGLIDLDTLARYINQYSRLFA